MPSPARRAKAWRLRQALQTWRAQARRPDEAPRPTWSVPGTEGVGPSTKGFDQALQSVAHRGQIIFPAPFSLARGELGITPLHFFFKVHAHAGHNLQILHHRLSDAHRDRFPLGSKFFEGGQ